MRGNRVPGRNSTSTTSYKATRGSISGVDAKRKNTRIQNISNEMML